MAEVDRFAIHRLQELTGEVLNAYETYEFHVIYHRLYNYCTLDLSAFYLDVLKDRLYTSLQNSVERRSAQTVMYQILDSMTRLMAPIISFTAEEIWEYMPEYSEKEKSVHMAALPKVNKDLIDKKLAENWNRILLIRGEVTKALELARANKQIGHALDAAVTVSVGDDLYDHLLPYADDLSTIFIVSKASLVKKEKFENAYKSEDVEGLSIHAEAAPGEKCERCWIHDPAVGKDSTHPTICGRCREVVTALE